MPVIGVISLTETAQVEVRSGRVEAPASHARARESGGGAMVLTLSCVHTKWAMADSSRSGRNACTMSSCVNALAGGSIQNKRSTKIGA